jgi:peptidoglycan/LPS O-acetylase OafA/YrhL
LRGQTDQAERIASLDLLRLVAALAVVGFHYFFRGAAGEPYLDVAYPSAAPVALYGYLGVNLFFLISGFVIAWSAEGRAWDRFAIARFARIYPGFAACMAVTFAVLWLAGDPRLPVSGAQFGANLAVFSPALGQPFVDGVYWSIVLELVFYGWVALALLLGVFQRWKLALVAGWLAICAINELAIGSGAARLLFITEFGPLFAAGVLIHHIYAHGRSRPALALLAASFVLSCLTMTVTKGWMQQAYGISAPMPALVAANLGLHALLVAAILARRLVAPSPLVLMLGGLTYPLYLLHQNVGYVAINRLAPHAGPWMAAALTLAVVLAMSWIAWRYVETPLRRPLAQALTRLSGRMRPARPANAAAG